MFLESYGLREDPFGVTPNPRFLFLSQTHREALTALTNGIERGRGFLTLTAEPGMGKTTLVFQLLERLRESCTTIFLFQTQCDSRELFRYLLGSLGADASSQDVVTLHEKLNEILARERLAGRRFVLVIDEAQNLDESVLETVRLLSDFETSEAKLIQILLVGQPQLRKKLASPGLAQLRQRIATVGRLEPLSPKETVEYIHHRLRVAGYPGGVLFTAGALEMIADLSRGIPRCINNLCFNALSLGYEMGQEKIDSEIVEKVAAVLDLTAPEQRTEPKPQATEPKPETTRMPETIRVPETTHTLETIRVPETTRVQVTRRPPAPAPAPAPELGLSPAPVPAVDISPAPAAAVVPSPAFVPPQVLGLSRVPAASATLGSLSNRPPARPAISDAPSLRIPQFVTPKSAGSGYGGKIAVTVATILILFLLLGLSGLFPQFTIARLARTMRVQADSQSSLAGTNGDQPGTGVANAADGSGQAKDDGSLDALTITVGPHESLQQICIRYLGRYDDEVVAQIREMNPGISDPNRILPGQEVWLPLKLALPGFGSSVTQTNTKSKATSTSTP
jgi:type II secretory pathway predicted ATPase ExeA/phage tail protein X